MKAFRPDRSWGWLALAAAVGSSGHLWGQQDRFRRLEEPRWLKLDISEVSAGLYTEADYEQTSFNDSEISITRNYVFVGPLLGLNLDGSIYHPYLVHFMINSEGAIGYGHESLNSTTTTRRRDELQYLGNIIGSVDILSPKPYRTTLFGNYDHSYRDYDFFNRVTVDSKRYGMRTGYSEGPLPVSVNYLHLDEDVTGYSGTSTWIQDVLGATVRSERNTGSSALNYNLDQHERTDFGQTTDGTDQTVSLSDTEQFGSRKQAQLTTGASYRRSDYTGTRTEQISGNANLTAEHRDNLSSYYDFTYEGLETGAFQSDNFSGRGELRHQLYESLGTTLTGLGSAFEASDQLSSGHTYRYGGGLSHSYVKRLSETARLQIDNSFLVEHVDQASVGTVIDESHSFSTSQGAAPPDSFFLNQPNVIPSTIVVSDASNSQIYVLGLDYQVEQLGVNTLITRPLGSRIPRDTVVLVDYQAEPSGAGTYESLSDALRIRFDLWNRTWGLYGRLNLSRNNAPEELLVPTLTSYAVGTDVTWRWLRAGAELEIYDSSFTEYHTLRFFQSFSFKPDPISSLSLDFTESTTDYKDVERTQTDFRFITRYHRNISRGLALTFDGGVALRRGSSVDQTIATARPGIEYTRGQTTVKAGYDFEYQLYLANEQRQKHLFFLRLKRTF